MNVCVMIGRLTKDPEVRYSSGENNVAYGSYTLAVDRQVAKNADKVTDFIYCKVVGKTAEFAEKYLRKGTKIAVTGRMQVDTYKDKDGNSRSTTYLQVLQHDFCEVNKADAPKAEPKPETEGFMSIPDGIDEELPFN